MSSGPLPQGGPFWEPFAAHQLLGRYGPLTGGWSEKTDEDR